jgi:hypothetical protein
VHLLKIRKVAFPWFLFWTLFASVLVASRPATSEPQAANPQGFDRLYNLDFTERAPGASTPGKSCIRKIGSVADAADFLVTEFHQPCTKL